MSTLKKLGRGARRLRHDIPKMQDDTLYTVEVGGQRLTLPGRVWKKARQAPKPVKETWENE
jgi:hypothetical protein